MLITTEAWGAGPVTANLVATCPVPLGAASSFITNSLAYVSAYGKLCILDVSDPTSPSTISQYTARSNPLGLSISGNYGYLAEAQGLEILDLSEPTAPEFVGYFTSPGILWTVAVSGDYLFLHQASGKMLILNATNREAPFLVGDYGNRTITYVTVQGSFAYVGCARDPLQVLDITDPAHPLCVGHCTGAWTNNTWPRGATVDGHYVYLSDWSYFHIIDVSDPTNPRRVGYYQTNEIFETSFIVGNFAVLGSDGGLYVLDISDPTNPTLAAYASNAPKGTGNTVCVVGNYAFLADDVAGLAVYELTFPPMPWTIQAAWLESDLFKMRLTGPSTVHEVTIESSPDLVNWTTVASNSGSSGVWDYTESLMTGQKALFYRATTR